MRPNTPLSGCAIRDAPLADAWKAALLDTRKPDSIGIIWPAMTSDADWAIERSNVGTMPISALPLGDMWLRCRKARWRSKLNHYWFDFIIELQSAKKVGTIFE